MVLKYKGHISKNQCRASVKEWIALCEKFPAKSNPGLLKPIIMKQSWPWLENPLFKCKFDLVQHSMLIFFTLWRNTPRQVREHLCFPGAMFGNHCQGIKWLSHPVQCTTKIVLSIYMEYTAMGDWHGLVFSFTACHSRVSGSNPTQGILNIYCYFMTLNSYFKRVPSLGIKSWRVSSVGSVATFRSKIWVQILARTGHL